MTNRFQFSVPSVSGNPINFELGAGDVLYLLGANGTGKSSLVARFFGQYHNSAKRISAHRQTWFESNTLDMTPRDRQSLENNTQAQDIQPQARYREWNPAGRATMAIFDLIDAHTMQELKIASLVRTGNMEEARKEAQNPSPIQIINEMMKLSNLAIQIGLEDGQKVIARKNGGDSYSVAELSDGERNAFLIASSVLTAKPGTLFLIDEPERHLHRSIISPLLRLLFDHRNDCSFIVSTHEPMLPLDTPKAFTLLVRSCEYQNRNVRAWTADFLAPGIAIDDDTKSDILGSRRKIIFVEGKAQSLDAPLYSLLFPQVSIIPKDNSRNVEHAVRGLRGADNMHWVSAWGIVDNDQRGDDDVARLKNAGIWSLAHYSVESLYYYPTIIGRIAKKQAEVTGDSSVTLEQAAVTGAIAAVKAQRDHLVTSTVLRAIRKKILEEIPDRKNIEKRSTLELAVGVAAIREEEELRFDAMISASDWNGLLTRYPLRESSGFDRIIDGLKIKDQATYRNAVLKVLQEDVSAVDDLRNLLGDLYVAVSA